MPAESQVEALADALNAARTVTLFAGAGVRDAHDEVMQLAGKLLAPVGHALGGKEWIQYDNSFDVGMSGLLGYGACHEATHEAERLVLLGTDFPYDNFLPEGPAAQVDHDPTKLGRRIPVDIGVTGDVGETIARCCRWWTRRPTAPFSIGCCAVTPRSWRAWSPPIRERRHRVPIHPEYVASVLDELADDDAVFTVDTGDVQRLGGRYLTPNGAGG